MTRLRESQKEKQRRHEDDSVNLGENDVILIMVSKRRPLFMGIGTMKRVKNEKGSVVSVTLAKPTVQVITCDRMMNVYFDCDSGFRQRKASAAN